MLIFVFINPRNITIQGIYIKVTSFNIYTQIFEIRFQVKFKFQKYIFNIFNIYIYIYIYIYTNGNG